MAGHSSESVSAAEMWGGNGSPFSLTYGKQMMWFFLISDALTFGGLLTAYGFARHAYTGEWPMGEQVFHHFPLMGETHLPLLYVAFMTFILIISSVTMVLAVEAGHRMDKKGVTKWLLLTVLGGFIFLGSQAWEWSHFIHGSQGVVVTDVGERYYLTEHIPHGRTAESVENFGLTKDLHRHDAIITGEEALTIYNNRADFIQGANLKQNEYGPAQYGGFFFFITGFHGFHVFSGVIINLLVLLQVIGGRYDKRGHFEMVEKAGLYWHFVDLVWVFVFTFFYLV
ncbi:MAG: cytochrome c oxidase subunit 3 [Flavobacteriales bacterium]